MRIHHRWLTAAPTETNCTLCGGKCDFRFPRIYVLWEALDMEIMSPGMITVDRLPPGYYQDMDEIVAHRFGDCPPQRHEHSKGPIGYLCSPCCAQIIEDDARRRRARSPTAIAGEAFIHLSRSAELRLQPPARAAHLADTLRQIGTWVADLPLTYEDLHHAFVVVGHGYDSIDNPTPPQTSRATTVRELASFVHPMAEASEAGLQRALTVWVQVALAAADRAEGDPRLLAIASTWEVESRFIGQAIADRICTSTREREGKS